MTTSPKSAHHRYLPPTSEWPIVIHFVGREGGSERISWWTSKGIVALPGPVERELPLGTMTHKLMGGIPPKSAILGIWPLSDSGVSAALEAFIKEFLLELEHLGEVKTYRRLAIGDMYSRFPWNEACQRYGIESEIDERHYSELLSKRAAALRQIGVEWNTTNQTRVIGTTVAASRGTKSPPDPGTVIGRTRARPRPPAISRKLDRVLRAPIEYFRENTRLIPAWCAKTPAAAAWCEVMQALLSRATARRCELCNSLFLRAKAYPGRLCITCRTLNHRHQAKIRKLPWAIRVEATRDVALAVAGDRRYTSWDKWDAMNSADIPPPDWYQRRRKP